MFTSYHQKKEFNKSPHTSPAKSESSSPFTPSQLKKALPTGMYSANQIFQLQKSIGNSAVIQLLKNSNTKGSNQSVIQRKVAAQIHPNEDDPNLIGEIDIIGRTENPKGFKGMGSHLTMWAVITDMIKNRLRGSSYDQAITKIEEMYVETNRLPGYSEYVNMTFDQQYNKVIKQTAFLEAYELANQAITSSPMIVPLRVQQLISTFLEYRNTIPLTTFDFGVAKANVGETSSLEKLRIYEKDGHGCTKKELRNAIMGTLDYQAMESAAKLDEEEEVRPDVPGIDIDDDYEVRMAKMIEQHLLTVEGAYPRCFQDANIGEEFFREWLDANDCGVSEEIVEQLFNLYGRD